MHVTTSAASAVLGLHVLRCLIRSPGSYHAKDWFTERPQRYRALKSKLVLLA